MAVSLYLPFLQTEHVLMASRSTMAVAISSKRFVLMGRRFAQEFADHLHGLPAQWAGEKTVPANTSKFSGQDMSDKSPNKLLRAHAHHFAFLGFAVHHFDAHFMIISFENAIVSNGRAVHIAPEVIHGSCGYREAS